VVDEAVFDGAGESGHDLKDSGPVDPCQEKRTDTDSDVAG
jgi:hypothetical protein